MKAKLKATEILAMVMNSKTGELVTIASSNRYDPMHIRGVDVPNLNPKFAEYPYEPGAVMQPITIAANLTTHLGDRDKYKEVFNTDQENFQIGKGLSIKDATKHKSQTMTDILVSSSNIGTAQIAWQIPGSGFHYFLNEFGFGQKSGIDLPRDLTGTIKSETLLQEKLHIANSAFGYGLMVTPVQLLKAYSAFTNEGWMVTPHIGTAKKYEAQEVLPKSTAGIVKQMLTEVVKRGTGKLAQTEGLTIGGKTGTAHIAKNGRYVDEYHSSFYGFAEDSVGQSYTIGVLVIEPKLEGRHYASQSAVPVFKLVVDAMVIHKLLIPEETNQSKSTQTKKFTIYTDKIAANPLVGAKVLKPYGEYVDPEYGIKVFNESVTLQSSPNIKKVFNILDGRVVFLGVSKKLGNTVVIAHKDKLHTVYAGLSEIDAQVHVGDEIGRGHVLGMVDETLVFQVIHDSKYVDPMKLIMSGKDEKKRYMQACDLNKDRKFFYKEEDIQSGVVSKKIALQEMQCMKERLPHIIKDSELLEWIIKKGYFEKFVEHFILPEGNSVIKELTCLYAKEKLKVNEDHPEYVSYVEMCGDTKVFGDEKQ